MEPAVTTVLVGVLGRLRPWGDSGDLRFLQGFQARWKPVLWLEPSPTAGGIAGSRRQMAYTSCCAFANGRRPVCTV